MRYAIIDAGRVTNIIIADPEFAQSIGAVPADGISIGYVWDGTSFVPGANTARTRADVLADLAAIDTRSIRALREGNATRIAELETQAQALRTELAAL